MTKHRSKKEWEQYPGPDRELVDEWRCLSYKPFHKEVAQYSSFSGFYSDCIGQNLFIALMEYLGENHPQTEVKVDDEHWKMYFSLTIPRE